MFRKAPSRLSKEAEACRLSFEWSSPRDGIVLERSAIEGMRVAAGGVLFRIADHSVMWALIDVAERDLGTISKGQVATVRARSFPGREFSGKVEVIYPEINKETRTARIRVELPNPDLAPLHDMYVDAEIDTGTGEPVLTVPESAVMDTGSRQAVFVDKGQADWSHARSSSAIAAPDTWRSARALPTASPSSSPRTS